MDKAKDKLWIWAWLIPAAAGVIFTFLNNNGQPDFTVALFLGALVEIIYAFFAKKKLYYATAGVATALAVFVASDSQVGAGVAGAFVGAGLWVLSTKRESGGNGKQADEPPEAETTTPPSKPGKSGSQPQSVSDQPSVPIDSTHRARLLKILNTIASNKDLGDLVRNKSERALEAYIDQLLIEAGIDPSTVNAATKDEVVEAFSDYAKAEQWQAPDIPISTASNPILDMLIGKIDNILGRGGK